jgi:hypothetical protein
VCAPSDSFQDEDCPTDQRPEAQYNIARAQFEQEVQGAWNTAHDCLIQHMCSL